MNKTLLAAAVALAYSATPVWANPTNNFTGDVNVSSAAVPVTPATETPSAASASLDNGSAGASGGFKQTATATSTQKAGDLSPQANEYGQANGNTINDNDTKNTTITKNDNDTKTVTLNKTDTDTATNSGKGDAKAKDQAAAANNGATATTNNSDQQNDKSTSTNRDNDGKAIAKDQGNAANNGSTATSAYTNAFNTNKAIAKIDLEGKVSGNRVSDIGNSAKNSGDANGASGGTGGAGYGGDGGNAYGVKVGSGGDGGSGGCRVALHLALLRARTAARDLGHRGPGEPGREVRLPRLTVAKYLRERPRSRGLGGVLDRPSPRR